MKKIALLLIFCGILISGAGAYIINPTAPNTINAGEPLIVNGTSNLPAGVTTSMTLSEVGSMRTLDTRPFTIQADGSFSVTFNTSSLESGRYRLELVKNNDYSYGSGSTLWLFVDIIDRRSELSVTSALTQTFDGSLEVSGSVSTVGDRGLKMQVSKGNQTIFGPEYISTTSSGTFSIVVPITEPGTYSVTLTDSTNYPWFITYTVLSPVPTTTVATTTEIPVARQVTQPASRAHPAYFQVETNRGELIVTTSSGVDWVVEYLDESGAIRKVNTRGTAPEEVRLTTNGGNVYFKVYPDQFEVQSNVTLSVENARTVTACTTCASLFGDQATTTTEAPLPFFIAVGAIALLIIAKRVS